MNLLNKLSALQIYLLIQALALIGFSEAFAQTNLLPAAHAHNDYLQERPLQDALEHGFMNIEVDVFLVNNQLVVSHYRPLIKRKSIEDLYLQPLLEIYNKNGGRIFPNQQQPLVLMVDLKNKGAASYAHLRNLLLNKFAPLVYSTGSEEFNKGSVQFIISGDRPTELIARDSLRVCVLDGRPDELHLNLSAEIMPWVSFSYKRLVAKPKQIPLKQEDSEAIRLLAEKVHNQGKRLRLWAVPHNQKLWEQLEELGVDILISDDLGQMVDYFERKK